MKIKSLFLSLIICLTSVSALNLIENPSNCYEGFSYLYQPDFSSDNYEYQGDVFVSQENVTAVQGSSKPFVFSPAFTPAEGMQFESSILYRVGKTSEWSISSQSSPYITNPKMGMRDSTDYKYQKVVQAAEIYFGGRYRPEQLRITFLVYEKSFYQSKTVPVVKGKNYTLHGKIVVNEKTAGGNYNLFMSAEIYENDTLIDSASQIFYDVSLPPEVRFGHHLGTTFTGTDDYTGIVEEYWVVPEGYTSCISDVLEPNKDVVPEFSLTSILFVITFFGIVGIFLIKKK